MFSLLQITFEISKPEEWQIPIWIILGSTLGGLLLLALLVLALWKVSSPQAARFGGILDGFLDGSWMDFSMDFLMDPLDPRPALHKLLNATKNPQKSPPKSPIFT